MKYAVCTGDKKIDRMISALLERSFFSDNVNLHVYGEDYIEGYNCDAVIVLYKNDDYLASKAHYKLTDKYKNSYSSLKLPFSIDLFLAKCRNAVNGTSINESEENSLIIFDPAVRTISRGDSFVKLTPKECRLFELLNKNIGSPVSKKVLYDQIWDKCKGSNAPDVCISYLRHKLIPVLGNGSIINVRGNGYMLQNLSIYLA